MSSQRHLRVLDCETEHEGFMATAIKVAFATSDKTTVDQHFGAAEFFVVYAVDRERTALIEIAQFNNALDAIVAERPSDEELVCNALIDFSLAVVATRNNGRPSGTDSLLSVIERFAGQQFE